jgi:hypothetical protein
MIEEKVNKKYIQAQRRKKIQPHSTGIIGCFNISAHLEVPYQEKNKNREQ